MIGSKEAQREPLPDGTTVIFLNNKEIVIRSPLAENRNALFYEAFDRNTGRVIVMKEFFPGHWVRHDSAPVLNGWEQYSAEEVRRGRLYIWLRHQAEREQQINWKLCCSVRCVIPEKKPLYVGTLRLPDGTEWQRPLGVFLEMDGMTAEPGFPLRALMQECTWPRSPEHPFGNLRRQEGSPGSGRSCAVPAAAVTMRVFRDILLALRQLHDAGWVMGKLDIGDVFVKGNLAGGEHPWSVLCGCQLCPEDRGERGSLRSRAGILCPGSVPGARRRKDGCPSGRMAAAEHAVSYRRPEYPAGPSAGLSGRDTDPDRGRERPERSPAGDASRGEPPAATGDSTGPGAAHFDG